MDPLAVSAVATVLNRVLGETAAEAGRSAWSGLLKLVRSAFPGHSPDGASATKAVAAVEQLTPATGVEPDQNAVIDLSAELVGLARRDAGFESALREWLDRAGSLSVDSSVVANVISKGATVHNAVQARDINGPVSFGG